MDGLRSEQMTSLVREIGTLNLQDTQCLAHGVKNARWISGFLHVEKHVCQDLDLLNV